MVEQLGLVTIAPLQLEVVGIDLRNQQRHQRIHAEVARVADDDMAGGGEGALDLAGDRGVKAGEHHLGTFARLARLDGPARRRARHGRGQPPRRDLAIELALRPLAGGQPADAKPRMARQPRDKLLTDDAGRA
jgi:hypothetical protein